MLALVSALNRVDLPTFGRPTMPHAQSHCVCNFIIAACISPARIRSATVRLRSIASSIRSRSPARGRVQHVVRDDVLVAGMTDSDPQPPEALRAELRSDVLQTVVARDSATLLEPCDPRRKVELVMRDEHLVGLDFEETSERADRSPRQIHVRLGQYEPNVGRTAEARGLRMKFRLGVQARPLPASQTLDEPESGVVAVAFVLPPGVAEAGDELDGHADRTGRDGALSSSGEVWQSPASTELRTGSGYFFSPLSPFSPFAGFSAFSGTAASGFSACFAAAPVTRARRLLPQRPLPPRQPEP